MIAQRAYIRSIIEQKGLCKWLIVEIPVLGGVLVLATQKSTWWKLTRRLCVFLDVVEQHHGRRAAVLATVKQPPCVLCLVERIEARRAPLRRVAAILIVALERLLSSGKNGQIDVLGVS